MPLRAAAYYARRTYRACNVESRGHRGHKVPRLSFSLGAHRLDISHGARVCRSCRTRFFVRPTARGLLAPLLASRTFSLPGSRSPFGARPFEQLRFLKYFSRFL
jgi:hypothetical protein